MVHVHVHLFDSGTHQDLYGSEVDVELRLEALFPSETKTTSGLLEAVAAINDEGFAQVDLEPYRPPPERNMLPADYDSAPAREDPWKRGADQQ